MAGKDHLDNVSPNPFTRNKILYLPTKNQNARTKHRDAY